MNKRGLKNKKGLSVMVSYILLVVFLIVIGGLVYTWLRTYVPRDVPNCQEGSSLFIKEAAFNSDSHQLELKLKNNGRFSLAGFFIYATNDSNQELATIDLSSYLDETQDAGFIFGTGILFFETPENLFLPGSEESYFFNIPTSMGELYSVEVIPARFEELDEKTRFVSCGNARAEQIIGEPYTCIPNTCTSLGYICGTWGDGCEGTLDCGDCTSPEVCNGVGQCIPPEECTDTCETYGYECGTWDICGISTNCGTCDIGFGCSIAGQCESLAENGICDAEETCADADCEGQQNGCEENYICQSGSCVLDVPPTVHNCADFCVFLGIYTNGNCRQNPAQCTVNGEIYESGGDPYCEVGVTDNCCCIP